MKGSRVAAWIATGFGAGYLPIAPGTWGSLAATIIAALLSLTLPEWYRAGLWIGLGVSSVAGVIAASALARQIGDSDPSIVVIDEIAGQFLTLLWLPAGAIPLLGGFLLFRLFDIVKPFPARASERLPGGWGIMADDWIAGFYAGAVFLLIQRFIGWVQAAP